MEAIGNIDQNYIKLAQLNSLFSYYYDCYYCNPTNTRYMEILLKSGYEINYRLPFDSIAGKKMPHCSGCTILHYVLTLYKNITWIELLLHYGADITCKNHNGFTPLHLFVEMNLSQKTEEWNTVINASVDLVLDAHLNFNILENPTCKNGISHFHIACIMNNTKVVKFFLKSGVSVNESVNIDSIKFAGYTALHFATHFFSLETIKLLLKYGANVNCKDSKQMTPLHLLINRRMQIDSSTEEYFNKCKKHESMIDLLIHPKNVVDDIGLSYFHASCTKMDVTLVKKFMEQDIDINAAVNIDSHIWPGFTPLHFAAYSNFKIVMFLLERGANIAAKDANGITPLDLCIEKYKPHRIRCILKTQTLGYINLENGTSLIEAVESMSCRKKLTRFLDVTNVNTHIPFDSPLWAGYTLFHLAVTFSLDENPDLVHACLSHGADCTIQNVNGMTPLHLAFRTRKRRTVQRLLRAIHVPRNSIKNVIDHENLSHFHIACLEDDEVLVEKFLKNGSDAKLPFNCNLQWYTKDGELVTLESSWTSLHLAIAVEAEKTIKVLLKANVSPNVPDAQGLTALQLAFLTFGSRSILGSLLSFGESLSSNYSHECGLSQLHIVCYLGDTQAVRKLLQLPTTTDLDVPIKKTSDSWYFENLYSAYLGYRPLHFAVESSSEDIVQLLIERGAKIYTDNNGDGEGTAVCSPLRLALKLMTSVGNEGIIRRLLVRCIENGEWMENEGLTQLHVACAIQDEILIRDLMLWENVQVNSQIDFDSTIWPGATSLHLLMSRKSSWQDENVRLLLEHGADPTIADANQSTACHWMYARIVTDRYDELNIEILPQCLATQLNHKFWSVNPINNKGVSHFHLSCIDKNLDVVKIYLTRGVDINMATDYHVSYGTAGFTPLHFAVQQKNKKLVELLLKHGADITTEDSNCINPITLAATTDHLLLKFIISITPKLNIMAKNTLGATILETLISMDSTPVCIEDSIEVLSTHGAYLNFVDFSAEKEFVAKAALKLSSTTFKLLTTNAPDLNNIDAEGCNAIHNSLTISSELHRHIFDKKKKKFSRRYFNNINLLIKSGCELEHKDNTGKTPLHKAAYLKYVYSTSVLLELGADINTTDNFGDTPCKYHSKSKSMIESYYLRMQIMKLKTFDLYLNKTNQGVYKKEECNESPEYEIIIAEEKKMRGFPVNGCTLNARDLLREETIRYYSKMKWSDRQAILKFFESDTLRSEFPECYSLFQLHYRKILARPKLIQLAMESLKTIVVPALPHLCYEAVFEHLSNEDLKNIIALKSDNRTTLKK